ncbi:hypothetical protein ACFLV7_06115 [Chloroflexota bacterium]
MPGFIQTETRAGETITKGGTKIVPFSKSLRVQIPGLYGGLIWNRPATLLVVSSDGDEQIIPIVDVTRQALWALLGVSLAVFPLIMLISQRRNKTNRR